MKKDRIFYHRGENISTPHLLYKHEWYRILLDGGGELCIMALGLGEILVFGKQISDGGTLEPNGSQRKSVVMMLDSRVHDFRL